MNTIRTPTLRWVDAKPLLYTDTINGTQVGRDDQWQVSTESLNRVAALLREALDAMTNLAPRVKDYDGCFGRMAGGGGADCKCTACRIRRELG